MPLGWFARQVCGSVSDFMSGVVGILLIFLLLVANGFFVAVEFALVAADQTKLDAAATDGRLGGRAAVSARKRLSFHLSGAQLGITVTSLILAFLIEPLVGEWLDLVIGDVPVLSGPTVSVIVALGLVSSAQMVIGELFPKAVAVSRPEQVAQVLAPAALVVHGVLGPIIRVFNGAANWTVRRLGLEPQEELEELRSLQELEYLIRSSGDSGTLSPEERQILTRTIRFGDKTAADALRPRTQVEAVGFDATIQELADLARTSTHSQFPVFGEDMDDIRGTVEVASVLDLSSDLWRHPITDILRPPFVVPETRGLSDILSDFRQLDAPSPMAIVVDEHGGTAGILTIEDVLEEIVGDVDDEYDDTGLTAGVSPGVYLLAGTLHPDEVADACGFVMPEGDYETLAGFVLERLGRIPELGASFGHEEWTVEVTEMHRLRVASLQLTEPRSTTRSPLADHSARATTP